MTTGKRYHLRTRSGTFHRILDHRTRRLLHILVGKADPDDPAPDLLRALPTHP